ncbi:multidrug resistance protein, MATE family, partial [Phenoliferia sp. Uapishka_3]
MRSALLAPNDTVPTQTSSREPSQRPVEMSLEHAHREEVDAGSDSDDFGLKHGELSLLAAVVYALVVLALGFSVANTFTFNLARGSGSDHVGYVHYLDTLASAIYTSPNSKRTDVGVVLQRCFLALGLLVIPNTLLWWFIRPVLLLLGQSESLAVNCQAFLRVLSLGAPGYVAFESVKKFLQVQGIMHASTLVLLVTSPINILLNYFFVYHTRLGFLGAPAATSITYWLSFFLLVGYCKFLKGSECWGGWSRQCLQRLPAFYRLAIPGILHVATEWYAFEIVALAAGRLGELSLSAQAVIMTCDQIMNTLPFGIGVAVSARIGNLLGASLPRQAKISSHTAVVLATCVGSAVLAVLMASRDKFGYLFSDEPEVVALVAHVLPYVAAFQIADGWTQSCGGVLRGMGKQHVGALVNLVAYYFLALPFGIWLAFKTSLGLSGLWIGQCAALFLVGIGQYILVALTHWDVEVEKAQARLESGSDPLH